MSHLDPTEQLDRNAWQAWPGREQREPPRTQGGCTYQAAQTAQRRCCPAPGPGAGASKLSQCKPKKRTVDKKQFSSGHGWWRACQNWTSASLVAPRRCRAEYPNVQFSPATARVEFRHQSAESAAFRPWRPFPSRPSTAKSTQGGHRALAASGRHARQEAAEARARGGRKSLSAGSSTLRRHKRRGDTGLPQDGAVSRFLLI
jgi:hypothetical protein|eukprot:SAG25_NODE_2679_length_1452_cov_3.999261_2_plen_202_part_00